MDEQPVRKHKPWEKPPDKFPKGKYRIVRSIRHYFIDLARTSPVYDEFVYQIHEVGYDSKGIAWVSEKPLSFPVARTDLLQDINVALQQPIIDYKTWKEVF